MVYSEFIMFIQGPGCPKSKERSSERELFLDSDFILRHRTATKFLERLVGGFLEIDFIVSWQFEDKE